MKRLIRMVWVLVSAFALCLTSCLNEAADPNSNEGQLPSNVAELASQVEAMKATVNEVESVVNELSGNDELHDEAAELEAFPLSIPGLDSVGYSVYTDMGTPIVSVTMRK